MYVYTFSQLKNIRLSQKMNPIRFKSILFRSIFFCLIQLLFCFDVKAQVPELLKDAAFKQRIVQALDSLYDMRFDASKRVLAADKKRNPNHPLWEFWDGLILWWQILPNLENTALDNEFYFRFRKSDYESTRILTTQKGHIDALVIKIIANGFIARQLANRDEWIKSLKAARVGIESLLDLQKIDPDMKDISFGLGLYDYYMAYLPTAYPVLQKLSWIMPDGDRIAGLNQLKMVADSGLFLRSESRYFLANIYQNYEQNPSESFEEFELLTQQFPHNLFYAKRLILLYYDLYAKPVALQKIDSLAQNPNYLSSPYLFTLKEEAELYAGKCLLSMNSITSAFVRFKNAYSISNKLDKKETRTRYGMACFYLGVCADRLNARADALKWLKLAEESKTEYSAKAKSYRLEMAN